MNFFILSSQEEIHRLRTSINQGSLRSGENIQSDFCPGKFEGLDSPNGDLQLSKLKQISN